MVAMTEDEIVSYCCVTVGRRYGDKGKVLRLPKMLHYIEHDGSRRRNRSPFEWQMVPSH